MSFCRLKAACLFTLTLLLLAGSALAATSVLIGDEELCVYEGRPLNQVKLYGTKTVYLPGYADADAVTASLSDIKGLQVYQSGGVPTLYLQTESGSSKAIEESKAAREAGAYLLVDAEGNVLSMGSLDTLHTRGNSSFSYDKKPYGFKLSEKADLLGMGKAKKWVLVANYIDGTLIRNTITLKLAQAVGLPYTPQGRAVDLYLNGSYKGSYLLCEKVQVGENRV